MEAPITRQYPEASGLLELIDAWHRLQVEVEELNGCAAAQVVWVPTLDRSWLVAILRSVLETAMESPEHYDAVDLVGLWDVGLGEDALDGDLVVAFLDAFDALLDEAIELADAATIDTILAFAAANGYPELEARARAASGGGG